MQAPLTMQGKNSGLQVLYFKDRPTMVMRRDVLDIMESNGVPNNWFNQRVDIAGIASRIGCKVAEYVEPHTPDKPLDIEGAQIDGI